MLLTRDDQRHLFAWLEEYRARIERVFSSFSSEEHAALLADFWRDYMCARRQVTLKRVHDGAEFSTCEHPALREITVKRRDFVDVKLTKLDHPCRSTWRDAEGNHYICE